MKLTKDGSGAWGWWCVPGIKHLTVAGIVTRALFGFVSGVFVYALMKSVLNDIIEDIVR